MVFHTFSHSPPQFSTHTSTILARALENSAGNLCALRAQKNALDSRILPIQRSGAYTVQCVISAYVQNPTAGPLCVECVYALYTVNTVTMRVCVTCASNSPVIDEIYAYCQRTGLLMHTGAYIHADESYWIWRIDSPASPALTWLLLQYPDLLCVY